MALTKVSSKTLSDNAVTADKIATGAITITDIPDGEITAAKLHTTAVTDKLGYTPVAPGDSPSFAGLTVDTNTLYVDSADNRVGIGTTNPGNLLSLSSAIPRLEIIDTTTSARFLIDAEDSNGGVNFRIDQDNLVANSTCKFTIDSTECMRIDSSGNVGIGTSVSESGFKLHVVGNAFVTNTSGQTTGKVVVDSTDNRLVLGSYYEAGVGQFSFISSTDNAETTNIPLVFRTGTTERMRITSIGNIEVSGEIISLINAGTSDRHIEIGVGRTGNGNSYVDLISDTTYSDFGTRLIRYNTGADATTDLAHRGTGALRLNCVEAGHIRFNTNNAERMRIDAGGFVGIGTSSPNRTLHIDSNGSVDGSLRAQARINSNLAYDASPFAGLLFGNIFNSAGNTAGMGGIGVGKSNSVDGDLGSYLSLHTRPSSGSTTERMRIDSSGNVGIGTSSPDHVVHVSSATSGNLLRLSSDVSGFNSTLTVDGSVANTIKLHAGYFDTLELGANDTSYLRIYTNGTLGYTGANIALDSNVANNQYITLTGPTTVVIAEAGYIAGTYYIRCTGTNSEQEIIINAHRKLYNNGQINILLDKSQTGTQALSNFRIVEDRTLGKCYLLADGVLPNNTNVLVTCLGIGTYPVVALAAKSVTEQYPTKPMLHTNGNMYGVGVYASTSQQGVTLNAAGQFIGANYAVFACNGDTTQINNRTNSTGTIIDLRYNGAIRGTISTNGTNIAYNTSSDYRLKENNVNITDGISKVKLLKPYRFNFIDSPDKIVDGFFAHEVQSIVPEAVTGEKDAMETIGNIVNEDGDIVQTETTYKDNLPEGQTWVETETRPVYQGIDQAKLVPLLTAALQEAIAEIDDLKARMQALENH